MRGRHSSIARSRAPSLGPRAYLLISGGPIRMESYQPVSTVFSAFRALSIRNVS
jgi:hypothetical protein